LVVKYISIIVRTEVFQFKQAETRKDAPKIMKRKLDMNRYLGEKRTQNGNKT
jgi:hypothetical protein